MISYHRMFLFKLVGVSSRKLLEYFHVQDHQRKSRKAGTASSHFDLLIGSLEKLRIYLVVKGEKLNL